ncbi:MAG: gliding motility-associated ABC transporter ATP-binding subunit GldA [Bacteroidales bacterium]|nr:gliding motility-associated ABC transporter ATP-binding subunit GldA [Bacteroidales bacterium]
MSLIVENVSKHYGLQKALDDVSFRINKGEVVALLGPNGAGKSTMMKIIACYLPQTAGKAVVCGYDVLQRPLEVKKRLGYLPENNPLYSDMYVKEYLRFVAGMHHLGKSTSARIDEMIELTGLSSEYKKTISRLSRGYRQRVGLAQALIHDPEVLILDEPTSGLDPNQLTEIRSLIRKIGQSKTVILSTHIMQEVEAVCSRAVIIHKGRIMADAPTSELKLLNKAGSTLLVEFDREADLSELREIEGVVDVMKEHDKAFRVFSRGPQDIRPALFRYAVEKDLTILTLNRQQESLEQVFRDMTNE